MRREKEREERTRGEKGREREKKQNFLNGFVHTSSTSPHLSRAWCCVVYDSWDVLRSSLACSSSTSSCWRMDCTSDN